MRFGSGRPMVTSQRFGWLSLSLAVLLSVPLVPMLGLLSGPILTTPSTKLSSETCPEESEETSERKEAVQYRYRTPHTLHQLSTNCFIPPLTPTARMSARWVVPAPWARPSARLGAGVCMRC